MVWWQPFDVKTTLPAALYDIEHSLVFLEPKHTRTAINVRGVSMNKKPS